ncbi:MAG: GNAT family N-acetyltransferase [Sandarakinorhabdus sp.]|nr:GNAT family N-acetyltransferase [Sandarakinorhabdus sp.]
MTDTPPTLRPATHHDLPALHALVERSYRSNAGWTHEADLFDGPRTDLASLALIIDQPEQVILVAVADGAPIASVQVSNMGDGTAYMGLLSVDPSRQSGGMGGRMIAAAEAEARIRFGAIRMEMTVIDRRAELIGWYGRRGYAPTGEQRALPAGIGELYIDLKLLVLEKPLA